MDPQTCNYPYTAEACAANCLNPGSASCSKNGITYYQSCGSSKCSSNQTCENGMCNSNVAKSGWCCGYTTECGYSEGTSHSSDDYCQSYWGMSCYNKCKSNGYPDCTDMHASCQASGGTPVFQVCSGYNGGNYPSFICE